jgi:Capsule assembly protein Wzi
MKNRIWPCIINVKPLKKPLIFFLIIGMAIESNSQINEPAGSPIYEYLYRMAQKGLIRWNDYQLPLDRKEIAAAIDQLSILQNRLTKTEAKELQFYKQEFAFDQDSLSDAKVLFRKDDSNRWRVARFDKDQSRIFLDPLIGLQSLQADHKNNLQYFSGVRLAGYFGKRWGFNFSFKDNTEKGDTLTHRAAFSRVEGIVPTIEQNRLINYSSLNFNIGYRWSNGALVVGQENLSWGYGLSGNIALSGRVPSFPFIKFDFSPWQWLHFSYFHGWLHSNIIDSSRSYNTGTGVVESKREVYFSKFIAHHAITLTPVKGLDVAIGESVIYSDKLSFGYLIPINFFKIYDQYNSRYNIKAGDNSQFFGFISSRNEIKNTHMYAQVFIDEMRISKVFNKRDRRNQLGYTLGINRTDLFVNYLTAGIEYSRVNPFVYNNLIPAETYTSHSYYLGDWMGNNTDRLYWFAQYVPLPKLRIRLSHQKIRKGESGTLDQQYFQSPQPPFLFKKLFDYKETDFSARYELINKLILFTEFNRLSINYVNASSTRQKGFQFGLSYGL